MRTEIIALLDRAKTINYFARYVGWDAQTVTDQILTAVSEAVLTGTPHAEQDSIMCYEFAGDCTKSGRPISGGLDISEHDYAQLAKLYPLPATPPQPPPPVSPPPVSPTVSVSRAALNLLLTSAGMHAKFSHAGSRDTVSRSVLMALLESAGAVIQ